MSEAIPTRAPAGADRDDGDPRLGTTLDGRYRLVRRLGEGGFGVVYEAEHVLIRRPVAVKMLHAQVATNAEVVARFRREAIAATATGHKHIVEVLDLGRAADGAVYMVLELLSGEDWAGRLAREGVPPLARSVHIVLQVLEGLAAAHEKGIVHRDLKAENVFLVERDGDPDFVKIVDFGISKMREEAGEESGVVTSTGLMMGTPLAMAPEQFQGLKNVDHRADLWAVGVMLYHALTGYFPFEGETYALIAVQVMLEPAMPLARRRPDLPAGLIDVVERLLAKSRDARYQSAREVREALSPYLDDGSPAPPRTVQDAWTAAATAAAVPDVPALATARTEARASDDSGEPAAATARGPGGATPLGERSEPTSPAERARTSVASSTPTRIGPADAPEVDALEADALASTRDAQHSLHTPEGESPAHESLAAAVAPARGARGPLAGAVAVALLGAAVAAAWALGVLDPEPPEPAPRSAPRVATQPPATQPPAPAPAATPEVPPEEPPPGTPELAHLVLWTTPSALASEGGRPLGFTPLTVDLPPGRHTLTLESPEASIATTHEVTLTAGATERVVLDLRRSARAGAERPGTGARGRGTETPQETLLPAPPPQAPVAEPTPPPPTPDAPVRGGLRRPQ